MLVSTGRVDIAHASQPDYETFLNWEKRRGIVTESAKSRDRFDQIMDGAKDSKRQDALASLGLRTSQSPPTRSAPSRAESVAEQVKGITTLLQRAAEAAKNEDTPRALNLYTEVRVATPPAPLTGSSASPRDVANPYHLFVKNTSRSPNIGLNPPQP